MKAFRARRISSATRRPSLWTDATRVRWEWRRCLGFALPSNGIAFVNRCVVPADHISLACPSAQPGVALRQGHILAAVELDSPSVLCGADSGEIPGVYRTAMLSNMTTAAACPRPSDVVSLFASPADAAAECEPVDPALFEELFAALDHDTASVPAFTQKQQNRDAFAYDLRCFCLACSVAGVAASPSSSSSPLSSKHSLKWVELEMRDAPPPAQDSQRTAAACRALLCDPAAGQAMTFSLPSVASMLRAWRFVRRSCFRVEHENRVYPCGAPLLSSHLLAAQPHSSSGATPPPPQTKISKWKARAFGDASSPSGKATQNISCRASLRLLPVNAFLDFAAEQEDSSPLLRVSSHATAGLADFSSASLAERYMLVLRAEQDLALFEKAAPVTFVLES